MPKLRILVTIPPHPPTLEELRRDRELEFTLVDEPSGGHGLDPLAWPKEWLRGKEIMFCSGVMPTNYADLDAIKWVQMGSAGYEQAIDVGAGRRGEKVSNALGTFDVAIGEWNVMMILALSRNLRDMIRN